MKKLIFIFMALSFFTIGCAGKQQVLSQGQVQQIRQEVKKVIAEKKSQPEILADKIYKQGDLIKSQNKITEAYEKQNKEIEELVIKNIEADQEFKEFFEDESRWSFGIEISKTISADPENIVMGGSKFEIKTEGETFYTGIGLSKKTLRFSGQTGLEVETWSFYFGAKYEPAKNFKILFDMGYYLPKYEDSRQTFPTPLSEGLWRYMNKELATGNRPILFPEYSVDYKGNFGARIGISYTHYWDDNEKWSSGFHLKYLYLKFDEKIVGYDDPVTGGSWNRYQERYFGGPEVGLTLIKYTY